MACINDNTQQFSVDAITYPCPNLNAGSANLC